MVKEQWFIKITQYADELLEGHKLLSGWPEQVLSMQKNWIGKSHGAQMKFDIAGSDKKLEMEFFSTLMEINMKVILKMIIMKDKGNIFMQMGIYMKANFLMIVFMEKEHLYILMEINMSVIGKMI